MGLWDVSHEDEEGGKMIPAKRGMGNGSAKKPHWRRHSWPRRARRSNLLVRVLKLRIILPPKLASNSNLRISKADKYEISSCSLFLIPLMLHIRFLTMLRLILPNKARIPVDFSMRSSIYNTEQSPTKYVPQLACDSKVFTAPHQRVGFTSFRSGRYTRGIKVFLFSSSDCYKSTVSITHSQLYQFRREMFGESEEQSLPA